MMAFIHGAQYEASVAAAEDDHGLTRMHDILDHVPPGAARRNRLTDVLVPQYTCSCPNVLA